MEDIAKMLDAIQRTFEEFKSANDERLKQVEKKAGDVITTEKVDRINAEITKLSDQLTDIQKKANRPGVGAEGLSPEAAEHKAAYLKWMRKGDDAGLAEIERKALNVGTPADGGYAVPEQVDSSIDKLVRDISPIRSIATVVTVGTPDYKRLFDINGTASGWVGETGARSATNTPQLAEVAPTMGEIYANPQATQTMLDDVFFNAEQWLAESVAEEFAQKEGAAFISGDGSNKPTGFLNGVPVATADASRAFGVLQYVASGQAAALPTSLDVLIDLVYALKAAYRTGAVFVMSKAVLGALRKYKDTTNQYLWQPSVQAGAPSQLMGYPVIEAEDMPAVGAGTFPIAFGNFRRGYTIVDRVGIRTLRDPLTNKPYIGFYTTKRVGGKVMNSEAIKLLKVAAS